MSQLRLKVSSVEALTDRIRAVTLTSVDGRKLPGYRAGAHIKVTIPTGGERHYSLINADAETDTANGVNAYRLGILKEDESKGGSLFMHALAPGDTVETSAPKNDFALASHDGPAILLAGGIGVTPMI